MDQSIFILRVVACYFSFLFKLIQLNILQAMSWYADLMLRYGSALLSMPNKKDAMFNDLTKICIPLGLPLRSKATLWPYWSRARAKTPEAILPGFRNYWSKNAVIILQPVYQSMWRMRRPITYARQVKIDRCTIFPKDEIRIQVT